MLAFRIYSTTQISDAGTDARDVPLRAWTGNDVLLWGTIALAIAVLGWFNPVFGAGLGFVFALVAGRAWQALHVSGRRGIVPAWWQKISLTARAVSDVLLQGVMGLMVVGAGFFFYALGVLWYDGADLSSICQLFGLLIVAVAAPGVVFYLYAQLPPIIIARPRPSAWWMRWVWGLLAVAVVDLLLLAAVRDCCLRLPTVYSLVPVALLTACLCWGNLGAIFELRSGAAVSAPRAMWLIVRSLPVLFESLLIGGAFMGAGLLLVILAANGAWPIGIGEVLRYGGLALAGTLAPVFAGIWWWGRLPRLIRVPAVPAGDVPSESSETASDHTEASSAASTILAVDSEQPQPMGEKPSAIRLPVVTFAPSDAAASTTDLDAARQT